MTGMFGRPDGWRRLPAGLVVCAVLVAAGCGGEESARLVDYLDELEFDVPAETAAHVSLGRYEFPIAASASSAGGSKFVHEVEEEGRTETRLQFEVTAETTPLKEKKLEKAAANHRGGVSDAVLTVLRTSTMDELTDPRLSAVRARLTERTRPMLGEDLVRQLRLNDPATAEAKAKEKEKSAHGGEGGHGDGGEAAHGEAAHGAGGEVHGEVAHADADHGDERHGEAAHGEAVENEDAHGHH